MLTAAHRRVLNSLAHCGPRSRSGLARNLQISKASVTSLTRDLMEHGLIIERDLIFGQGRPATQLSLRAEAASFIGISLQSDPIRIILTDLRGQPRAERVLPRDSNPQTAFQTLAATVRDIACALPEETGPIMGIGVAQPGFVSQDRKICLASAALGWKDVNVADTLSALTGLPVSIENDANVLALAEQLFGERGRCQHFSLVCVADGIGSAHIISGRLHRGAHGGAGEIAHSPLLLDNMDAKPCRCGNRGCLDTIASLKAIDGAARQAAAPTDIAALAHLAAQGDPVPLAILHRAASALGLSLAQIVQMFDPTQIVVLLPRPLRESVFAIVLRQETERHVLRRAGTRTELILSDLHDDAFAIGAASLAAQRFVTGSDDP